jgi:pilus assembly protein FimV
MIITCKNCNTSFNLSDELVKDTGSKVKCSKCNYIFQVYPPHTQKEPDVHQSDLPQEPEENISTKSYLASDQDQVEGKSFPQKADLDRNLDLADIEKILQEEEGKTFDGDALKNAEPQENFDDFEFADLDDLFGEEDKTDDQRKERESTGSDKESDLQITSGETELEDIDLSELDDFFKEDDDWVENLSGLDSDSKVSGLEFDIEKEKTSNFLEPEDFEEEVEDIDLSELDDLFREDEIPSLQTSDSLKGPDILPEDDDEILSINKFLDDEEEISLNDGLEKKEEQINLSEIDDFFRNETDDDLDFNLEIETEDDNKTEPVSEKIDDDIDFDFDLDLEMEKESADDQEDIKSSQDFEMDFDFAEKDQDHSLEFDSADMDYGSGHDEKDSVADVEKSEIEELKFNFEDLEKKDEITDFDEEFDLSDLEEIIDLEEESGVGRESLKSKNEDEEQKPEFDLVLEPDIDEVPSLKVVIDGEELELDTSEKAVETESEYSEKINETAFDFDAAENREEAFLTEKDDYNPEETEGKFHKVFDTVTLIDRAHKDESDDNENLDTEDEEIKPRSRFGKMVLLVVLVFLLLAAAGYGVFNVLNMTGSQIPIIGSYMKTEIPDPGNLKMIAFDLNSKFEENQHTGKIFIITGIIKNEYSEARSFIKSTGKIYEPAKKLSHTEHVYAGNVFSELELRSLDMEAIKNRLDNRFGQNRSNVNIEPGQSVPFMIIFSNLPQQLEEFTVEIESSSPA